MKSFLIGGVFGIVLGALLTYLLLGSDAVTQREAATQTTLAVSPPSSSSTSDASRLTSISVSPTDGQSLRFAESHTPGIQARTAENQTTVLMPERPPSSLTQAQRSTGLTSAPLEPIPLSDAHQGMLTILSGDGHTLREQHTSLETEPRDDAWSYYMEQMLGGYLLNRAPSVGVEIVGIVCRSTTCEIQAYNNGGSQALDRLLIGARDESWWEFSSTQSQTTNYQNRERSLVFLKRAGKSGEAQHKNT